MKKIIIVFAIVLMVSFAFGQAVGSAPTVSSVQMVQQGGLVRVTFNLSFDTDPVVPRTGAGGAANADDFLNQENYRNPVNCHISLAVSNDGGTTYKVYPNHNYLSGDVGSGVTVGEGKEIIWNIRAQYDAEGEQGIVGENYRARIIARRDDNYDPETHNPEDPELSVPAGMVFVQGTAGVTFNPGGLGYFNPGDEGGEDYDVSLSSFYISQFEVTQAEWTVVMGGIYDPDWEELYGLGPNHPAYFISWFDAIDYCNRRSMMEGFTPCYSYSVGTGEDSTYYGTIPDDWPEGWKTRNSNNSNVYCNWEADGYRLPTDMKWEYAARGGVTATTAETPTFNHLYAGTNVAGTGEGQLGDYAWYRVNAGWDLPGNTGHPDYGTHPAGTKLPNELNLYDMSGNVYNWVWDILANYPTGVHNNPTGPTTGSWRFLRGGSWSYDAISCRVDCRDFVNAAYRGYYGFRVSRSLN